jgi:uncharacterized membrane protein YdcZ (DUF606 family)
VSNDVGIETCSTLVVSIVAGMLSCICSVMGMTMSADICMEVSASNNDPHVGETVFVILLTFTYTHTRHKHMNIKQLTNTITLHVGNVVDIPIGWLLEGLSIV